MDDLKKAYKEFLNGWQDITGPGGFCCFEAGYYHAQNTANELIKELSAHLDYCGWGDSWERECSAELRQKLEKYIDKLTREGK